MEKENELFAVIPAKTLSLILEKLDNLEKLITDNSGHVYENEWLNSKQVKEALGVSQRTYQCYRDKGLIKFTQIGSKIYVKRKDLDDFLEKHALKAYRKW